MTSSRGSGALSLLLGAAGLALVAAGYLIWSAERASGPAQASGGSPGPSPTAGVKEAVRAPWTPGAPRSVVIPELGVRTRVVPVKAPGGTLVPPADPTVLGWWSAGARPGDATGSALITGHTVHTGGGALDDLESLERGDVVRVRTRQGSMRYSVRSVRVYDKGSVAAHAEELFSQEVAGRLVLVTCEDWDGARYLSNVVVIARPARENA
ncbi:class F sortase [Nocardioides sp.]|uniref:class F sortase n=1 Tax=Nocardioides sp. TaxID=35761 RepID=UPI003567CABD